ncbi:MAG: TonB-dependent receptor [Acidobacteria bacterium]|nr:TonB-dependent receptor [Acidobacteriota bacterium]
MVRPVRIGVLGALVVLLTAGHALAQATAQINGTVADPSGGVLPGATVTAIQTDTGLRREVVTDADGSFRLTNLPLGPYQLEVALSGFRTYSQTGIVLQVGSSPTINMTLTLGDVTETVSVAAETPLVDTQRAGIGAVIENERILELPLNGRNPMQLIELAGAAVVSGTNGGEASTRSMQGSSGGVEIAVAGGLGSSTAYMLDGAMHNNPYDNLNLPLPFPDALQEFRVETGALDAASGMHTGASVQAVTKSGTNVFHGGAFEFWRNHRFNATHPFARVRPDGTREGDGLNRNQFGGTLGGPIINDRLFFFGGYQGTYIRQTPTSNVAFVPTPAMLAGDFTQLASPACAGQQLTLRGPFVNNRVNPALFSPAALQVARRLPSTTDPCGRVTFGQAIDADEGQSVGRIDYQLTNDHGLFGRYIATTYVSPPPLRKTPDNLLAASRGGFDNIAHSFTLGETWVVSSTTVNAFRAAINHTNIHRQHEGYFSGPDVGVRMFSYLPDYIVMTVVGGFNLGSAVQTEARYKTTTFQIGDDLTMIRGGHQFAFGANLARWNSFTTANVRAMGNFTVNGQVTGHGLGDFLLGNVAQFIQANPNFLDMYQWYAGVYANDTWRLTPRLTLNYGVRWEPFFPQQLVNEYIYNFDIDRFRRGVKSGVFRNAPAGFLYPGDEGFVGGRAGMNRQWDNFAPRVSAAWDVTGDGRTSLRAGYGLGYDFVNAQYHLNTSVAPPWGADVRILNARLDDPYATFPGGNPFPRTFDANAAFPAGGQYLAIDPDQRNTRKQSWNAVVERQVGTNMAVSASYIGNYTDRLWNMKALNPARFLGLGPCTLPDGTFHAVCSTQGNVNQRRELMFENPVEGRFIAGLDLHDASGTRTYHGLVLAFQRRSAEGVAINANYTLSTCEGHPTQDLPNIGTGWSKPEDPDFDRGACEADRRHLVNMSIGVQTPDVGDGVAAALVEGWRLGGIVRAMSGAPLTVSTGQDRALNGITSGTTSNQRGNLVGSDPYGSKTPGNWLNPLAFEQPALGTFGNTTRGQFRGPSRWVADMVLARLFRFGTGQQIEVRAEVFNVFNTVRWGNPIIDLSNRNFGRILPQGTGALASGGNPDRATQFGADDPRILQFAVKYAF